MYFNITYIIKLSKVDNCFLCNSNSSRVAGYRFLLICLNSWHTAKLYIFGKIWMWLIEISMSSLSSVVTLWDNLGQRSNPYFSNFFYQTLAISFLSTFFVIFIQKNSRSGWEMIKVYNPISFYALIYILRVSWYRNLGKVKKSLFFTTKS